MSLTLSNADVEQLHSVLRTLLSPLSYPSLTRWQTDSRRQVEDLLRADRSFSMLPVEGEARMECEPDLIPALRAWAEYYHKLDTGFLTTRRELGLETLHCSDVYDMREHVRSEKWNDWNRPHGLFDATLMAVEVGDGRFPAMVSVYHEHKRTPSFGERGRLLFRIMLPAFKASVHASRHLAQFDARIGAFTDLLSEGLAVFDVSSRRLHENTAFTRLIENDPERYRLAAAVHSIVRTLGTLARGVRRSDGDETALQPVWREIRTGRGRYHLRGNLVAPGILGPAPVILVSLQCCTPAPADDAELQRRFRLTPREREVARLLAQGRSNAAVAQALQISGHTARRHTERVLAKLGVASRAAVAAKLSSPCV